MSHFLTYVLVPTGHSVETTAGRLMEPYREDLKVPFYQRECGCLGLSAQLAAQKRVELELGSNSEFRESFQRMLLESSDPSLRALAELTHEQLSELDRDRMEILWETHLFGRHARLQALIDADPDNKKPEPDCSQCHGKGSYQSDYNPKTKWDWWTIGGRFDGIITRTHGCDSGKRLISAGSLSSNTCPAKTLLEQGERTSIPFAVVTPDGVWHEKGKMGYFGCVSSEKTMALWNAEVRIMYRQHFDTTAVALDCHI